MILNKNPDDLKKSLESGSIRVCVIGIGRIGLPTALSIANSGLPTIGVDVNQQLVEKINSDDFPLKDEPGLENIFHHVLKKNLFKATTKIDEAVPQCDVILMSLPTPIDQNNVPDYSALLSVGNQLNQLLSPNSLIVVESTIEPGFVENELIPILENSNRHLTSGIDFSIGVCPESANPGEILKDFTNLPRLVGAIDEKTTDTIISIYHHTFPVELVKMPNCKTANAVKLTTNVFRDLNIAFVNELSLLFEKLGIDTFEVLEAAKRKYNFQIHYPGAGVGGPCLPVNSYQILNLAKKINPKLMNLVQLGREINEKMPNHVVDLTENAFEEAKISIEKSNILILGISYKPNVKDIQLSPAEDIVRLFQEKGANVRIFDPYYKNSKIFGIHCENELENALKASNAVVILTAHDEFNSIEPDYFYSNLSSPILIDSRGIINDHTAKKVGLIFRGIGRKNC